MIGNGVCLDSFTCRVVVEGHRSKSKLLSALKLLSELQGFEIPIFADFYEYLVVKLCEENRPIAARSLLERISQTLSMVMCLAKNLVNNFRKVNA